MNGRVLQHFGVGGLAVIGQLLQQAELATGGGQGEQLLEYGAEQGRVLATLGDRVEAFEQGQARRVAAQQVEATAGGLVQGETADQRIQGRQLQLEWRVRVFLQ